MPEDLRKAFEIEMALARGHFAGGDLLRAMHHLERAHILGQRAFWPHFGTHAWMLKVAFRQRDLGEWLGQVLRLVAMVPGHLFGTLPLGNPGSTSVPFYQPRPIPPDLRAHFED